MAKRKKKKSWKNKNDEAGLAKYVDDNVQSTPGDGNGMKKSAKDNERKKKKENYKDDSSTTEQEVFMKDSSDNDGNSILGMNETRVVEVENADKVKKENKKSVKNDPNDLRANKSNKKVRFSGHMDVFPPLDDSNPKKRNNEEDNLVRGKRFTPEEDEIVKEVVFKYILEHELGEQGLNMVLNCKKYPNVKYCWKEIGTAISYRPYRSIYQRAHFLFRRSENRNWTQEECERILKYHEEHGNRWKALADIDGM
ncbi:hypothetical protein BUALT_Bualt07G0031100 [Buddleja alternifolia]|uniref:Myb-like domain-containing protein n=1 Tax=Buddleja alternifolia TaxID=168488 RepID=A0AAV6XIJ8_9LAMI|nr:hypothetical protein BUALT_Bualt07G0031100 [Buddleja alternifolia]